MIFAEDVPSMIFENNTFNDNVGMYGGAMYLKYSWIERARVKIMNNTFERNMAYM